MAVQIQKVVGAIRATEGIIKSRKYAPNKYAIGGSRVRSCGVYTAKCYGTIIIDFWNSASYKEKSEKDLAAAIATLRAKGMDVVERAGGYGNTYLEVIEVA